MSEIIAVGLRAAALMLIAIFLLGCRRDMHDQPKFEAFEQNAFFADGRADRPQVAGTVARGELRADAHFHSGLLNGELAASYPIRVTGEVLARGRQRFDIFCSPCHGRLGDGTGLVAERGFRRPPSYHSERLRQAPPGHFFDVITNGFGSMSDFADRISPADRWAIAAYIEALQFSQHAPLDELPSADRARIERLP